MRARHIAIILLSLIVVFLCTALHVKGQYSEKDTAIVTHPITRDITKLDTSKFMFATCYDSATTIKMCKGWVVIRIHSDEMLEDEVVDYLDHYKQTVPKRCSCVALTE